MSEDVDAGRCAQLGLVNWVVPDAELFDVAFGLAAKFAAGPRRTLGLIKENLDDAMRLDFLEALDAEARRMVEHGGSPEAREAIRAFVESRAADFEAVRRTSPPQSSVDWMPFFRQQTEFTQRRHEFYVVMVVAAQFHQDESLSSLSDLHCSGAGGDTPAIWRRPRPGPAKRRPAPNLHRAVLRRGPAVPRSSRTRVRLGAGA